MESNIIYFTKEDGQNKMLLASRSFDPEYRTKIDFGEMQLFKKWLGHYPTNIYVMVNGHEFRYPDTWIEWKQPKKTK